MSKLLLILLLSFNSISYASINPRQYASQVADDINHGKLKDRTIEALENALKHGASLLRKKGYNDEADQILSDWNYNQRGFILESFNKKDLGDHAPVPWLYSVWFKLNSLLGKETMEFSHLDDLYIFAYSIPVVFWCLDNVDSLEFSKHFIPFSGSLTYWTSLIACWVLSEGAISLICGPLAIIAEAVMRDFIAPVLSPKMWEISCK